MSSPQKPPSRWRKRVKRLRPGRRCDIRLMRRLKEIAQAADSSHFSLATLQNCGQLCGQAARGTPKCLIRRTSRLGAQGSGNAAAPWTWVERHTGPALQAVAEFASAVAAVAGGHRAAPVHLQGNTAVPCQCAAREAATAMRADNGPRPVIAPAVDPGGRKSSCRQIPSGSTSTAQRISPLCAARSAYRRGSHCASSRCSAAREGDSTSICMRSTSATRATGGGTAG